MSVSARKFKSIPINHNEIPQNVLNIENKTRSNLFNWNGQFSPQFIEALLERYAEKDYAVVDPFLAQELLWVNVREKELRHMEQN